MYNLDKKKCVIVLAALIFSIAASNVIVLDKSDRDYDYEDSYNDNSDYDYEDDRNTDYDYNDRSDYDQDQDSDINLDDIKQNNKNGDNYIIVENKQESVTEKILNFADKILSDDEEPSYYNPNYIQEDERGYSIEGDFGLNVLIGFNTHYNIDDIPNIKVTAGGKKQILKSNDIDKSKNDYYTLEAFFNFD